MADTATKDIPETPTKTSKSGLKSATKSGEKPAKSASKPLKSAKKMSPSAISEHSEQETNGWENGDSSGEDEEAAQTRSEAPELDDDGEEEAEDELTERDPTEPIGETATNAEEEAEDDVLDTNEAEAEVEENTPETERATGEVTEKANDAKDEIVEAGIVSENGDVVDEEGSIIGKITGGEAAKLAGNIVDEEGQIRDKTGKVVGNAEPNEAGGVEEAASEVEKKSKDSEEKIDEGVAGIESPKLKADDDEKDIAEKGKEATDDIKDKKDLDKEAPELDDAEGELDEKAKETTDKVKETGEDVKEGATEEAQEASKDAKPDVDVEAEKPELDEDGKPIDVESASKDATEKVDETVEDTKGAAENLELPELQGPFKVDAEGVVTDAKDQKIGDLPEGANAEEFEGKNIAGINAEGELLGENETVLGNVDLLPIDELPKNELPDISILKGLKVNKLGKIVDGNGKLVGELVEGNAKKLAGKEVDAEGQIWNNGGKVIGRAETVPEDSEESSAPFEDFPDSVVDKSGKVMFEGKQVGIIVEGEISKLVGKKVDADGDVLDKNGSTLGRAERKDEEEPEEPEAEPEEVVDYSQLADKKVNKAGNVVDDKGAVVGRIKEGVLKVLIGKKVDKNGEIWNDAGKVIGKAEPIPENEREDFAEPSPFEDFPDALVEKSGNVVYDGKVIGKVVDGDAKKLAGKKVDADGDIVDKNGNVLGKAERWEEEEAEPEPEADLSALAGKRVNKAGNVVDSHGDIYGRIVDGDVKRLAGKMCDKQGFVRNEGGDVIGKAELIPEAEREGLKEGPFTDFPGCTVSKDGKVVTASGDVVGRLVKGDGKTLFGRAVDEDGDVLDKNGNSLGKAERWEEEEVKKDVSPLAGRKVNKEGNVVDENGDLVGKLTDGSLQICAGKKVDDDGDVVDSKGKTIGHVSLLEDIPAEVKEEEPKESEEEKKEREQAEVDKKLAGQMASCIEQSLDKIKPILKMITDTIDKAERTPKDELDEEDLVKKVRPLIEEGGRILTEANGVIRGLDPDGRISANAKHKTAAREASPEEYRLADLLKELTGNVTTTIENAKKKIEDMPHAKKELNPLWGLLAEPLGQILAAVGLLLSGVLGLVGKLLSGLGLGGLVDGLLGSLGISKVLAGLGLGGVVDSITGKKGGKKGGLFG